MAICHYMMVCPGWGEAGGSRLKMHGAQGACGGLGARDRGLAVPLPRSISMTRTDLRAMRACVAERSRPAVLSFFLKARCSRNANAATKMRACTRVLFVRLSSVPADPPERSGQAGIPRCCVGYPHGRDALGLTVMEAERRQPAQRYQFFVLASPPCFNRR